MTRQPRSTSPCATAPRGIQGVVMPCTRSTFRPSSGPHSYTLIIPYYFWLAIFELGDIEWVMVRGHTYGAIDVSTARQDIRRVVELGNLGLGELGKQSLPRTSNYLLLLALQGQSRDCKDGKCGDDTRADYVGHTTIQGRTEDA